MTEDEAPAAPAPGAPAALSVGGGRWSRWLGLLAVPLVLLAVGWWLTHPDELPTTDETTHATTKTGRAVYVGVTTGGDPRELHVRDVEIERLAEGSGVDVKALVCHGGSIGITANPEPFCDSVEEADGAELQLPRDQLIVSVSAQSAQTVALKEVRLSFREDLRWGTHPVGQIVVVDVRG